MTENEAKACAMLAEAAYLTGYMAANATTTPINETECSLSEMLLNVHATIKQAIEQLGKPAEPRAADFQPGVTLYGTPAMGIGGSQP